MFNTLTRILLSRRFTVYLLVATVLLLIVGSSVPDTRSMTPGEREAFKESGPFLFRVADLLGLQRLISSPSFLILPVLIFLSTAFCSLRRLSVRRRKESGFPYDASGRTAMNTGEIASLLSSSGWVVVLDKDFLTADKGRFGFWGSMGFHLGLLIVFIAVIVSFSTRFNAELLLTEGFPVKLGKDAFVKVYKSKGISALPPSTVELEKFIPSYEQDRFARDFAAELRVDGTRRTVRVNQPIEIGEFQLSLHRFGFAPSFRMTDAQGRELLHATVNLVVVGGKEDSFAIPGTPYLVYAQFFPDFFSENSRLGSRSITPRNPVFLLRLMSEGKELGKGTVALGRTLTIDNLAISFSSLNYWVDLIVGRDYGLWIFAAGFGIGILGLGLRFMLPDKQLEIRVTDSAVSIKGWSKYFPSFFEDEVKAILEQIQRGGWKDTV